MLLFVRTATSSFSVGPAGGMASRELVLSTLPESSDASTLLESRDVMSDFSGEVLRSKGGSFVSGYSSSKRWIMRWRVWSRRYRRPLNNH